MGYQFTYNKDSFCESIGNYAVHYASKNFEKYYNKVYSGDKLVSKSRVHAIYHYIINLVESKKKKQGFTIKELHEQVCSMGFDIPKNLDYFTHILKRMRATTIEGVLQHNSKGGTRHSSRIFTSELRDYADVLYCENLWTYRQITDEVNDHGRLLGCKEVKIHSVKKYFANQEVQNRLRPIRNGYEWYLDNIGKLSHFIKPNYSGELFEIDGSRLQIPYNNEEERKIDFLSVFAILDVASGKTVGYSHSKFENSKVVINAFLRFLDQNNFLPKQIIRDNSSAYLSGFKFFENITKLRGVNWVATSNPRGKPHVERFFKTFAQSICGTNQWYIGLGITTKHLDSRYSKSQLKKRIGDRTLLPNREELVFEIDNLFLKYNETKFDNAESPNERFLRLIKKKKYINLSEADRVLLTKTNQIVEVSNSEIRINYNKKSYYYQFDEILGEKLSLSQVLVAFDMDDLDSIYVFDQERIEFLVKLEKFEEIPFMESQRTSTQKTKAIKEILARKNRFKKLVLDISRKKEASEKRVEGIVSFDILTVNKSKEIQIESQNRFTRQLLENEYSEKSIKTSNVEIFIPPIKFKNNEVDKSKFKNIVK